MSKAIKTKKHKISPFIYYFRGCNNLYVFEDFEDPEIQIDYPKNGLYTYILEIFGHLVFPHTDPKDFGSYYLTHEDAYAEYILDVQCQRSRKDNRSYMRRIEHKALDPIRDYPLLKKVYFKTKKWSFLND